MIGMKEIIATLDDRGRVTLPASIRKALGVKAGDLLFFKYIPEENKVQVVPINVKHEGREITE